MNGPSRAAALPRIPAVNPAETLTPVSAAAQLGGAGDGQVRRADRQRRAGVDPPDRALHPAMAVSMCRPQLEADQAARRALPRQDLVLEHLRRPPGRVLEHLPFLPPRAAVAAARPCPPQPPRRRAERPRVIRACQLLRHNFPGCLPLLRPDLPRSDLSFVFF